MRNQPAKSTQLFRLLTISMVCILFFSSCANLYMEKRRYNRGFYISAPWSNGVKKEKSTVKSQRINRKKPRAHHATVVPKNGMSYDLQSQLEKPEKIDVSVGIERSEGITPRAFIPVDRGTSERTIRKQAKKLAKSLPKPRKLRSEKKGSGVLVIEDVLLIVSYVIVVLGLIAFAACLVLLLLHLFGVSVIGATAGQLGMALLISFLAIIIFAWIGLMNIPVA